MQSFIEIGGKVNDTFRRNIIIKKEDKEEAIKNYHFKDTYSTIYEYDDKDQNKANFIAPLYLDLDIDDLEKDFSKLKRDLFLLIRRLTTMFYLSEDNIEIYFSGSKGFHVIIPYEIFGFDYSKDLNSKYKTLALELNSYTITKSIDTRIYDNKRLFREPNTINSKTGLYKVQISLNDLRKFDYNDIIEYASSPKEIKQARIEHNHKAREIFDNFIEKNKQKQKRSINSKIAGAMIANKELLPCVKYILANGAVTGGRNNTAIALASALFQREMDEDKVMDVMLKWNEIKLDEPLPHRELEATVKSAHNNVKDGRKYGCGAFIDLGICVKGCPIRK